MSSLKHILAQWYVTDPSSGMNGFSRHFQPFFSIDPKISRLRGGRPNHWTIAAASHKLLRRSEDRVMVHVCQLLIDGQWFPLGTLVSLKSYKN